MKVRVTWVVIEAYDWKSLRVVSNDEFCYERVNIFDYCDHRIFWAQLHKKHACCIEYHLPNAYLLIIM